MCSIAEKNLDVSSLKQMKKQLNSIFFTDKPDRLNVVCFKVMASAILSEQ